MGSAACMRSHQHASLPKTCSMFTYRLQHKENLRVTVEGANNGGLLSRVNGLSLFVPVSQLEKKGHNEWWTEQVGGRMEQHLVVQHVLLLLASAAFLCPVQVRNLRVSLQDMLAHFAGQEVSLAVLEVTRASRKVVCSVVKAKENDDLRQLEVGGPRVC